MSTKTIGGIGLLLALVVAFLVSPWSSPHPDGLEWVAQVAGFGAKAKDGVAPLEAVGLGGLVGVAAAFGLGLGLAKLLRRGRRTS